MSLRESFYSGIFSNETYGKDDPDLVSDEEGIS